MLKKDDEFVEDWRLERSFALHADLGLELSECLMDSCLCVEAK